jgi:hypothetical protein
MEAEIRRRTSAALGWHTFQLHFDMKKKVSDALQQMRGASNKNN